MTEVACPLLPLHRRPPQPQSSEYPELKERVGPCKGAAEQSITLLGLQQLDALAASQPDEHLRASRLLGWLEDVEALIV
jgi:hypothetical protein